MKRILSMFITIVMVVCMLPTAVYAEDVPSVKIGGVEIYSTDSAKYYVNGATEAFTNEPDRWNAKYENNILTLNDADINVDDSNNGIEAKNTSLKIILIGNNKITTSYGYGIRAWGLGLLEIEGNGLGTLTINASDNDIFVAVDQMKINKTKITLSEIHISGGKLEINNSAINLTDASSYIFADNIAIAGSKIELANNSSIGADGSLLVSNSQILKSEDAEDTELYSPNIKITENSIVDVSRIGTSITPPVFIKSLVIDDSEVNVEMMYLCESIGIKDSEVKVKGGMDALLDETIYVFPILTNYMKIDNSKVEIIVTLPSSITGEQLQYVSYNSILNVDFTNFTVGPIAPDFTDDYVVYAGNDAASATEADASNVNTYANKYVRIEPKQPQQPVAPKSTVEFMVDGKVWRTYSVTKGADIKMPEVPVKEGYVGKWDHSGENIRTATTITAVYTEVKEKTLEDYSKFDLDVYTNSRVTDIKSTPTGITVEGYMFKENADLDKEDSIWREIIFVNEEDYSTAKAYRKQVTPVYNTWLNKNMNATGNGKYKLDYANYTVAFSTTNINSYVDNKPTTMAKGSYLAYMRISDGTNSYLFPLKDIVLSDGSTLELPTGFEVVDSTRALRYIVK